MCPHCHEFETKTRRGSSNSRPDTSSAACPWYLDVLLEMLSAHLLRLGDHPATRAHSPENFAAIHEDNVILQQKMCFRLMRSKAWIARIHQCLRFLFHGRKDPAQQPAGAILRHQRRPFHRCRWQVYGLDQPSWELREYAQNRR